MRQAMEIQQETVVDERRWAVPSLLAIVSTVIGAVLEVVGIIVLLRGDMRGSWSLPVVRVAGLTHTPMLGLIEIALGAVVALAGLANYRGLSLFSATALAVFGVVVLVQPDQLRRHLAVTHAHGWWAIGIAAALVVAALLTPVSSGRVVQRRVVDTPEVVAVDTPRLVAVDTTDGEVV